MNSVAVFDPKNTVNFVIPGLTRNPANNSHVLTLLDTRFRGYDEYVVSSPLKPIGNID
ncbi:hypothetical protein [Nitrosovibrio sp. Nv6]|uniref:hypothetical protein n=1 Tax=Nitrosovibrio sp. Nv6 TaxID=1855340 RepID=UPI0008B1B9D1|nr:hypothetical protein [Nitrosovibrio sp. Nv6]SEP26597.1 hypothetical protein SAMN05216316_2215 [Nitrosovibrio sp. Nv6]